jgi:hypothetical protein
MLIRSRLSRSRHRALLFAEDEALVEDPGGDDDEGQSDDYAREPVDREQVDQSVSVMRSRVGERAHRCWLALGLGRDIVEALVFGALVAYECRGPVESRRRLQFAFSRHVQRRRTFRSQENQIVTT